VAAAHVDGGRGDVDARRSGEREHSSAERADERSDVGDVGAGLDANERAARDDLDDAGRRGPGALGTATSIGTMAVDPCFARVSRASSYDHHLSVPDLTPALFANVSAVAPLRRHRSTVACHHALVRRVFFMRRDRRRPAATAQQRGRSDGYCELNGRNPIDYLADVLLRIDRHPVSRIDELLPDAWTTA
jgi:hypothetical protein